MIHSLRHGIPNAVSEKHVLQTDSGISNTERFKAASNGLSREMSRMDSDSEKCFLTPPATPLLHRVDRLDEIISVLEDKYSPVSGKSGRLSSGSGSSIPVTPSSMGKRCKPVQSVLEETQEKGPLIERVSSLEKRILTLTHSFERSYPKCVLTEAPTLGPLPRKVEDALHGQTQERVEVEEMQELNNREEGSTHASGTQAVLVSQDDAPHKKKGLLLRDHLHVQEKSKAHA